MKPEAIDRKEDMRRLIRWMVDYPDKWAKVTMENNLSADECIGMLEELEKEQFYLLIPIFLSNCLSVEVESGKNKLIAQKLIDSWKDMDLTEISKEVKEYLIHP